MKNKDEAKNTTILAKILCFTAFILRTTFWSKSLTAYLFEKRYEIASYVEIASFAPVFL